MSKLHGMYDDISLEQYHEMEGWSKSSLDIVNRSMQHFTTKKEYSSPALIFGSALHCSILTPELFEKEFAVAPKVDKRTKAGKTEWAEFIIEADGKQVISIDDKMRIDGLSHAIFNHPFASSLFKNGVAEQSFFWTDKDTDLLCKVRPDYLRDDNVCIELKTTDDARFDNFQRKIASFRYHVQGAYFMDGIFNSTQRKVTDYVIVAVERDAPHGIMCYRLDEQAIDVGRLEYKTNLNTVLDWKNNPKKYDVVYPESEGPMEIFLPGWYK